MEFNNDQKTLLLYFVQITKNIINRPNVMCLNTKTLLTFVEKTLQTLNIL